MAEVMKGNFMPKRGVEAIEAKDDLESRFEREALKRLGGSIAYVAKNKVKWGVKGRG